MGKFKAFRGLLAGSFLGSAALFALSPAASASQMAPRSTPVTSAGCPAVTAVPGSDLASEEHPNGYAYSAATAPRLDFVENEYELPTLLCQSGLATDPTTGALAPPVPIQIPVYFTVFCAGATTTCLPSARIQEQVAQMNTDFTGTDISFVLDGDKVVADSAYSDSPQIYPSSLLESQMKSQYRQGGYNALNVYALSLNQQVVNSWDGIQAWSTMPVPDPTASDINLDGVVIDAGDIGPGAKTVSREVGYWLSLYRTWHNGLQSPGDYVADTPPVSTPWYQCSTPPGSQNVPGNEIRLLTSDMMTYTPDTCRQAFTPDQAVRMAVNYLVLRKSVMVASPPPVVAPVTQSIRFTSVPPARAVVGGSYSVTAVGGGSANPVTFSSAPTSVCSTTGSTVSFVGPGVCTITAEQAGGYGYAPADPSIQSFAVSPASAPTATYAVGPSGSSPVGLTPDGKGYWLIGSGGTVSAHGDAGFFGSAAGVRLDQPTLGIAPTSDGRGYWLVAGDGGVFAYGDARFFGSATDQHLAQPVVGLTPTSNGRGYWLVAGDGGVFAYGDARFYGSAGGQKLARPIVGMAVTPDGGGYWLVGADGGVFAYGDARFYGSAAGRSLIQPVAQIIASPDGRGYQLVQSDGQVIAFGDTLP